MAAHPLIHSLQSSLYTQSVLHQHGHMHQHAHQHAFTPIQHQPSTVPPAPTIMETQDRDLNMQVPGGSRPSFAPVTAFHRATQKSFRTKQRRWGALHVCIAWKIYYQEQLKKMQQRPIRPRQTTTKHPPAVSLPDPGQHKQPEKPSCMPGDPDSACGQTGERSETGKTSDLSTSSPASCHHHMAQREKLERPPNPRWKEKPDEREKRRCPQTEATKDLPLGDKTSRDRTVTPGLGSGRGGSLDRKRKLECDSFIQVKRVKQETLDDRFDSSKTPSGPTLTPARTASVPHISIGDLSTLYPDSRRCHVSSTPGGLISYPAAGIYPYQAASWEPAWDTLQRKSLHSGLNHFPLNTCRDIGIPLVACREKQAFCGFFAPSLYFPLALRQQEAAYLRGRELLHPCQQNPHLHHCRWQLPHPGSLATSYLGP